jgi:hypothetical protein
MKSQDDQIHVPSHEARIGIQPTWFYRLLCLSILAVGFCNSGVSQNAAGAATQNPSPAASTQNDSQDKSAKVSRQELQNQQRKDQLTADTAKLLQLANELKAEMDKSTKDTLSISVLKKADQVEKLAHKVRDEMKLSIGN